MVIQLECKTVIGYFSKMEIKNTNYSSSSDSVEKKKKPKRKKEMEKKNYKKSKKAKKESNKENKNYDVSSPFDSRIVFGRYCLELIRKLGQGSFSKVYLVYDYTMKKYCVLKCSSFVDPKSKNQLKQEHTVLKMMRHVKGVPKTYGYYASKNYRYILQDHVTGCDMFDYRVVMGISFSEKEIFLLFKSLHTILGSMHSFGIVHHDIKLENVMINPMDLSVTLIDFGFSEIVGKENDLSGSKSGSLEYMAPEKLRYCHYLDGNFYSGKKSDIYSMAIVLWAIAYKCFPFTSDEATLRAKSKHDYPPSISENVKNLHSDLLFSFLCSILTLHPLKRPSLEEMLEHEWVTSMSIE